MKRIAVICIIIAVVLAHIPLGTSASTIHSMDDEYDEAGIYSKETTSDGYVINISIDEAQDRAAVSYRKTNESKREPAPLIKIDTKRFRKSSPDLNVGDSWNSSWDLRKAYDARKNTHNVSVFTIGPSLNTTTHYEFDLTDPNTPATRIEDVEVIETTRDGEETAALDVEVVNPALRSYPTSLFIHTFDTHGLKRSAIIPPGENRTVERIYLNERPGEEVEGELRLTSARLDEDRGVRDQVWFRGTADGETEWQREEYEPVAYRGANQSGYRYGNDGFVGPLDSPPSVERVAVALVVVFVVALGIARRYWWT